MENTTDEKIKNFKKVDALFKAEIPDFSSLTIKEAESARALINYIKGLTSNISHGFENAKRSNLRKINRLISNYDGFAEKIGFETLNYSLSSLDSEGKNVFDEKKAQISRIHQKLEEYDSKLKDIINLNNKTIEVNNSSKVKNSAELQVNEQNKSTVAIEDEQTKSEEVKGNLESQHQILENITSEKTHKKTQANEQLFPESVEKLNESESKSKLASPIKEEVKKYANFSDLPSKVLGEFQKIFPELITEINALKDPIPPEQKTWNQGYRFRMQNEYNRLAKANNLEELDVGHDGDFPKNDKVLKNIRSSTKYYNTKI